MPSSLPDTSVSRWAQFAVLRGWMLATTDLPEVIEDRAGAPRPPLPYGMLNLVRGARLQNANCILWETTVDAGEERVVERRAEQWEWMWSINIYGGDAFDDARVLQNSLEVGGVRLDHLTPAGGAERWPLPLTIRRVGDLRRLPDLVENRWEERTQFDLTLGGVVLDGFLVEVAESGTFTLISWPSLVETPVAYAKQ